MNVRTAWICCLLAGTVIFHCEGIQWLGIYRQQRPGEDDSHTQKRAYSPFTHEECMKARTMLGLKKRQFRFCKNDKFGGAMHSILISAKIALFHCGNTFSDRRWNCSSALYLPKLRPDLHSGTREQAFVYAIASAAMVYSIARGCANGKIKYCICDYIPDNQTLPNSTYHWADCHHNVEAAKEYVMAFLGIRAPKTAKRKRPQEYSSYERSQPEDLYNRPPASRTRRHQKRKRRRKKKRSVLKMMNNHNYMAGIRIIERQRKLYCKCHGVSGSCSVRTCNLHLRLIDDQKVIRNMRDNYLKAIWVKRENQRLVPVDGSQRDTILPTDLVFVKHSPDYCLPDKEVGSFGTQGRKCNATVSGSFNCDTMCCGRGYSIFRKKSINERCDCSFSPDVFKVVCRPCAKTTTHHICN